jgi:hypothetical protein
LRVPEQFIGLGDMSRGGLLLRCVKENRQLDYVEAVRCSSLISAATPILRNSAQRTADLANFSPRPANHEN